MADSGRLQAAEPGAPIRIPIFAVAVLLALACASPSDPLRYRLREGGERWDVSGRDRVLEDLAPRYPDLFEVVLNGDRSEDPPTGNLRDDLEKRPVDRANYDALNAVAVAYFEMNQRGEQARERGDVEFITAGFRAAKMVAVPWRAYMEIEDGPLRDAILDFFEDVSTGAKAHSARTRGRLARIVGSLIPKEPDLARRARLEHLTRIFEATLPPLPGDGDETDPDD